MANWNELFYQDKNVEKLPEPELYRFVQNLEKRFPGTKLNLWDLGCGGGRHTIALAKLNHNAYGSDNAPRAIELTKAWAAEMNVDVTLKLAEMTEPVWSNDTFHGVFSWDVIHHNTLDKIQDTINVIHESLLPGGVLVCTLKSDKADLYGRGQEIEPKTFVLDTGKEAGVPHHYFNEEGLRELFDLNKWEILVLAEQVITNYETKNRFWEYTPFRFTNWGVMVAKKG